MRLLVPGQSGLSASRASGQSGEQPGQHPPLSPIEQLEERLFRRQVFGQYTIDHIFARGGELHKLATPVIRIRYSRDESS